MAKSKVLSWTSVQHNGGAQNGGESYWWAKHSLINEDAFCITDCTYRIEEFMPPTARESKFNLFRISPSGTRFILVTKPKLEQAMEEAEKHLSKLMEK